MAHKVITPPVQEPIPIVELRAHLRVDAFGEPAAHPDDDLIMGYLAAAREHAEMYVGYALAPQVWEMALDGFPLDAIELEGGTVKEVVSVSYVDAEGYAETVPTSGYVLDSYSSPNWLLPAYGGAGWPATRPVANGVRIRYTVGHEPLPRSIRAALLLIVGHLYVNRESVVIGSTVAELPMGAMALLRPFRIMGA